jgi:WD40 repeat protein
MVSGSADGGIRVWELATAREKAVLPGFVDPVSALVFTPDSKLLASAPAADTPPSREPVIKVWDVAAGKEKFTIRDLPADVPVLAVTPDGKKLRAWLAVGSAPAVETYDLAGGKSEGSFTLPDHEQNMRCLSFTADAAAVVFGNDSGVVRLCDVARKEKLGADLPAHAAEVRDLALSTDRKTLVTGDIKGQVKVWDVARREAVHTLAAHKLSVAAIVLSPDGKRFATVGMDNVVKLWDTRSGKELRAWDMHRPTRGPDHPFVRSVAFTPDDKYLATANADTTLYLLECP